VTWALDSGTGVTGGGSECSALLAYAGGVLYGTELGLVTLTRIGFFCFPIKHSTHTQTPSHAVYSASLCFVCVSEWDMEQQRTVLGESP